MRQRRTKTLHTMRTQARLRAWSGEEALLRISEHLNNNLDYLHSMGYTSNIPFLKYHSTVCYALNDLCLGAQSLQS